MKRLSRILCLILMVGLLISSLAVSAYAAEGADVFYDLDLTWIDYSYEFDFFNESSWTRYENQLFYPQATDFYVRIPNPKATLTWYIALDVYSFGSNITFSQYISSGLTGTPADTYLNPNAQYSMVYWPGGWNSGEYLYFHFTVNSLGKAFTLQRGYISYANSYGKFNGTFGWGSSSTIDSLPYHDTYSGTASSLIRNFRMTPNANYDHFGFFLTTSGCAVSSITATTDINMSTGNSTPLEVRIDNGVQFDSGGNIVYQSNLYVSVSGVPAGTEVTFLITVSRPDTSATTQLIFAQPYFYMDTDEDMAFFQRVFYHFQLGLDRIGDGIDKLFDSLNPDQDTSQGEALKEQGQQMAEYEKQHQTVLQNGVGTLQASSNIGNFATALAFVGNYTTSTFNSLGDYQVVITLPLVIGLIMFLASRSMGDTKPTKSDKSVQRQADQAEKPKSNDSGG